MAISTIPLSALLERRETSLAFAMPSIIFFFYEGLIVFPTKISSSRISVAGGMIPSASRFIVWKSLTSDEAPVGFSMMVSVEFLPLVDS